MLHSGVPNGWHGIHPANMVACTPQTWWHGKDAYIACSTMFGDYSTYGCSPDWTTPDLHADYVQRYARPDHVLGKAAAKLNQKDSEDGEDEKMEDGEESDGGFLSSSDDEDS